MLRIFSIVLVIAALFFSPASAAIAADEVTNIPGYGQPPSRQYSGLIPADAANTTYLHYWYVESYNSPDKAPLLLWLNGGPGCSSLEGYLFENGPLHFTGTKVNNLPTLEKNPYTWVSFANVLYLESPAGVGFSYYVNGSTSTTDEITSQNNYYFLLNFFKSYPELAKLDFYITGESYAGIYIPTLVDRIRLGNEAGNPKINLIGFAVGNGCWGNEVGACAFYNNDPVFIALDFFHGHAFISEPSWAVVLKTCGNVSNPNITNECLNAANEALNDFANAPYNIYNIYNDCPNLLETERAPSGLSHWLSERENRKGHKHEAKKNIVKKSKYQVSTPDFCTSPQLAETWLVAPDVQKALHTGPANVSSWSICSGIDYDKTVGSLLPLYPTLISNYRTLIFSGDVDACVPYVGSEAWVRGLDYPVTSAWAPWTINDQVAGYRVGYKAPYGFDFITVKGSGHMVPQYQPAAALAMITSWINGTL